MLQQTSVYIQVTDLISAITKPFNPHTKNIPYHILQEYQLQNYSKGQATIKNHTQCLLTFDIQY